MDIKVTKITDGVRITINEQHLWINQTKARQLIADIMAALGEPLRADMTHDVKNKRPNIPTQAHQEYSVPVKTEFVNQEWFIEPDIRKGDPAFEADLTRFTHLYKIMMQRGLAR